MEKQTKKQVKKVISWVLILALVALLAALPMIASGKEQVSGPQASILSARAENRAISTAILGGGSLATQEALAVTLPADVRITEYLVQNGDTVTAGQPIASVDRVSVMTAITQVQETMEYLQEELNDISGDTESAKVTATAGGTVKAVYAAEGEKVQDVMLRHGALAVLSLDGMMAVQIQRSTSLSGGDSVCVTLSDGTEVTGRVESNLEGILTVTIEDEDFALGEEVKVTTEDGDRIGTGTLYIHSPWNVLAYSGTVSRVRVSQGDTVRSGYTLFHLTDTGHTAQFDALSAQHREYEALMLELFRMYQSQTVNAPGDGMVTGVDDTGAYMLSGSQGGWTLSLLTNAPNGDDETAYVNYVGQVTQVGIDGLIMKMNPQALSVADYLDLSAVPLDTALMTEEVIYNANAPVYQWSGEEWLQIGAGSVAAGDILLFAGDSAGNFVWVVRVGSVQSEVPEETDPTQPSDPSQPTEPGTPIDPSAPTDPSTPADPSTPTGPGQSGGSFPQGSMPSFGGGGMAQEDAFELYGLDTVTIASVTPQESATVQITVDELDISSVYVGQPTSVTLDALTGQQFEGAVTSISASGENEGGNSKFTVEVTLQKSEQMLPGMRASVSIVLDTAANTLCIPVAALTETETGTLVYTGYDEETEVFTGAVTVETGVSDGEYVQILSGIPEGTTVFYPYYDTLVISSAPEAAGGFPFG